jgi:hypothetical protein
MASSADRASAAEGKQYALASAPPDASTDSESIALTGPPFSTTTFPRNDGPCSRHESTFRQAGVIVLSPPHATAVKHAAASSTCSAARPIAPEWIPRTMNSGRPCAVPPGACAGPAGRPDRPRRRGTIAPDDPFRLGSGPPLYECLGDQAITHAGHAGRAVRYASGCRVDSFARRSQRWFPCVDPSCGHLIRMMRLDCAAPIVLVDGNV